ncbi:MAG: AAA family ATPase, partial [Methanothrix sp.]
FRKAKQAAPSLIFFDEVDSIVPARGSGLDSHATERVVSQFLTELDGVVELKDVVILAATNRPDLLDPSLLRPGRFDRMIKIPMPDGTARERIFYIHLSQMPLAGDVSVTELSEMTEGWTGADIETLCREAGMLALRERISPGMKREELVLEGIEVEGRHFREAFRRARPHLTPEMVADYQRVMREFDL